METTVVTAEQARADWASPEGIARRDDDLRSLALTNLLGLHTDFAYWNPDLAPPVPEDKAAEDKAAEAPPGERPPGETSGGAP